MASLPLLFGSIFAGAVVIDYGVKHTKTAFATSAPSGTATGAVATAPGAGGPVGSGGPISSPNGLTVKGAAANGANVQAANAILSVAHQLGVSRDAAASMVYAAIYESGLLEGGARNSLGYGGVLAGGSSFPTTDSAGQARAFLLGDSGKGYQAGGAAALIGHGASIAEAAIRTEVPSIWPANSYAGESGYGSDARAFSEARAWVDAYGGFQ